MTTSLDTDRVPTPKLTPVDFDPFAAPAAPVSVPLSEAQREIWTAVQMGPEASCAYNVCFVLRVLGPVDVEVLRAAAGLFFERHDALRMSFDASGESQSVRLPELVDVPLVDLSELSAAEAKARVEAIFAEEVGKPFDLVTDMPARVRIVTEAPDRVLLVFTAHHIVCDGWAAPVLAFELPALYSAARTGETPSLPPAGSFSQFLQEEAGNEGQKESALAYWRTRFADGTAPLDLPLDHARPPVRTYAAGHESVPLGEELSDAVRRLAGRRQTTIVGFLLGAFQALLHRLAGRTDVVVGLPISTRSPADDYPLVGHATNFLLIRVEVDGEAPFSTHLDTVKTALLDAQDHQAITFGALVRELQVPRDPSRTPLVAAAFNVARGAPRFEFADAEGEMFMPPRSHVNFELDVNVLDTGRDFIVECTYNSDLFEAATVRRWLGHYTTLLAAAVADPEAEVGGLPLLTGSEREAFSAWNQTEASIPADCVHDLISVQAARTPDRVALKCGDKSLTYNELEGRSARLARRLRGQGVKPGVRVGVFLERGLDMVVGVLGALKAGGAYVPLDPAYPAERLRHMLEDSEAAVLLVHGEVLGDVPTDSVPMIRVDEESSDPGVDLQGAGATPEDLAYVIYTSGSTGKPKGVAVTHRNLVNFLASMARQPGLGSEDVLLSVTTLSFDIAALELYLPLMQGGRVVMASREETQDGRLLVARLGSSRATVMQATPATWRLLIESGWEGTSGLKVLCGGEALPRDLADELLRRGSEVWNMYGPTETTVWSSLWRVEPGDAAISVGRPIANTQMHVLDARLAPQPVGVPGELYIGGAGVAQGYWERPELTAERFVEDVVSGEAGARLYRTGDVARWLPDGRLECLGRADHQVKVRGFRIELGEIEAALESHPAVKHAVVVAQDRAGGDRRLVGHLILLPGAKPTVTVLREQLRTVLPVYMVPSSFVFVDRLPLTPNGKVDRRALLEQASGPLDEAAARVPPRSEMEQSIADLWREALGIEEVGVHDNFFDLGGHSLLAAQVLSRIEKRTGQRIHFREITFQTLEQLAAGLEAAPPPTEADSPARGSVIGRLTGALKGLMGGSRSEPA